MQRNDDLRAARRAHPSTRTPSAPLSRAGLAELANAEIYRSTGRIAPIDAHYVARLERGAIRWPGRQYRAAFAAVLGATEADLGFRPPRREATPPLPPGLAAVALAGNGDPAADADAFDRLAAAVARPGRVDASTVAHLADVLARQRQLEDVVGAARVLPAVLAEVEMIESLAADARGRVRTALIGLASEYRQFLGWLGEDSGDPAAALAHYDRAADAALEVATRTW